MTAWYVALDVLREAASRRWLLALFALIAALLITVGLSLEMRVVDGALAAVKLFGQEEREVTVQAVDVALRPLFRGVSFFIFFGGLFFGALVTADFAPSLLAPGRIEHLLSLPVRRASLLLGTYVGVLIIAAVAFLFAAGGFVLVLGVKTGAYVADLVYAGLLGALTFAALYGAMLTCAVFVRSAAASAFAGLLLFAAGIVASFRYEISPSFSSDFARQVFEWVTMFLPPVATVGQLAMDIAASTPVDSGALARTMGGMVLFGVAMVALGVWRFGRMDF